MLIVCDVEKDSVPLPWDGAGGWNSVTTAWIFQLFFVLSSTNWSSFSFVYWICCNKWIQSMRTALFGTSVVSLMRKLSILKNSNVATEKTRKLLVLFYWFHKRWNFQPVAVLKVPFQWRIRLLNSNHCAFDLSAFKRWWNHNNSEEGDVNLFQKLSPFSIQEMEANFALFLPFDDLPNPILSSSCNYLTMTIN
jgi:hypothetical protein